MAKARKDAKKDVMMDFADHLSQGLSQFTCRIERATETFADVEAVLS